MRHINTVEVAVWAVADRLSGASAMRAGRLATATATVTTATASAPATATATATASASATVMA